MKWTSHKILTFSITLYIFGNAVYALVSSIGSIFPDLIEGNGFKHDIGSQRYNKWRKNHRGVSHLLVLYICSAIVLFLLYRAEKGVWVVQGYSPYILGVFFFLGCCGHILQDAVCGKVPIVNPKKRYGIKLFRVGSVTEHAVTIVLSIILVINSF